MPDITNSELGNPFEEIKEINEFGAEYWSARDLMPLFGYEEWRNFNRAIKKSIVSCGESGNDQDNHFVVTNKMVEIGSGAKRKSADYSLSRFACYLIAQNGNPQKTQIARAQGYFAIQARRQELSEQALKDRERIDYRDQCSVEFNALSGVAKGCGVQNQMFGVFHDAGYKGMYLSLIHI